MNNNKTTIKDNTAEFADLAEIASYYLKYWKWFILSIAVFGVLTVIFLMSQPNVYSTQANVLIKTEDSRTSALSYNALKSLGFGGLSTSESIDDEVLVMSSYTLTKQMIYELGLYINYELGKFPLDKPLYNNSPVVLQLPRSYVDTLSEPLLFKLKIDGERVKIKAEYDGDKLGEIEAAQLPAVINTAVGEFTFRKNAGQSVAHGNSYSLEISVMGLETASEKFMKKISVHAATKKANVINLAVEDFDKQRGKNILNKLMELYNIDALDDKNKMALNTANFIKERVDTISEELGVIERGIEDYKRQNNLIDVSLETGGALGKVVELKEKDLMFEIQLGWLAMIDEYVNNPDNKYALIPPSSAAPGGVSAALADYNEAILDRAKLLKTASETNPAVVILDSQLDLLRGNVKSSINSMRKEIIQAKKDWSKAESSFQSKLHEVPRQERQMLDIKRQQQIKSEIYLFLLQKLQEAELTLASNTPKAKIVDAAYTLTKPIAPRRLIILAVGLLIGAVLPFIFIYLRDLFKPHLSDMEELKKYARIPVLGEICNDKSGNRVVVSETSATSTAELFRLLRSNLQFILNGSGEKVILVTSSISGEGKSFFTVNLAASLSLIKNKKVVIVGLDIRNPKLTEYLSARGGKGITTYLSSEDYKPSDIIQSIEHVFKGLFFVPSGPVPPNPSELLLSERLPLLFDYLRENFDYVIVDTAPVGMVSDTFTLSKLSDATLYLFRANYTNKTHLKFVNAIAADEKLKKVYLVMNGTKTKSSYGYGYGNSKK
ncbi:MAG: polysaccharide biosynthesis tyrosine autokinase [Prevotella sp.]|jgi:capsular exopolysaccharide synthesis family protein|nr:polysaccharide biosynthesis tyrosine autokinase [Prevotella sp.]